MAEKFMKWMGILLFTAVGLLFLFNPAVISWLPRLVHYLIGIALLAAAAYGIYTEVK